MEIKTSIKPIENQVKLEKPQISLPKANNLLETPLVKNPELNFQTLPDNPNFMMELKPLQLFDNLEKEYSKVKDFDFKKVDVKDVSEFVKRI